ncbi:MAG TPA: tyrosine-type recombinase/integrase [Solirubrobacteraceae bacterium]
MEDALPYALAGYGMGRRAQIQRARWQDTDLDIGLIDWGVEESARKSRAARRVVPTVKPLLALLKSAYEAQGCPSGEQLVCPPRRQSKTGLLYTKGLAKKAETKWNANGLRPIGLHESRHTAATWLDAAGVSPKVASELMGHSTAARQAGAAPITLDRYTHLMPDAFEKARTQLDRWLAAESAKSFKAG